MHCQHYNRGASESRDSRVMYHLLVNISLAKMWLQMSYLYSSLSNVLNVLPVTLQTASSGAGGLQVYFGHSWCLYILIFS